jgi:type II secretory ATPase GspE/PulE/Tfp pilus assembly ATPase PilB-like protein
VLIDDPRDLSRTDHIKALVKSKQLNFSVAIKEDIEAFIKLFFDDKSGDGTSTSEERFDDFELMPDVSFEEEEEAEEDHDELDESSGKVVKLVDQVLITAYRKNASDIHIEPSPVTKSTGIRFRIDGVCQNYITIPNAMARGVLSRVKIMSHLDIAERRLPQDGKIKFKRKGIRPFELRVATLPTTGGFEDAVLRILASAGAMKLDDMALSERNLSIMKKISAKPYGLIPVVGPTGSGKTTTLHAALAYINKPGVKIWTAEDPVEITQPGLRQVEAKPRIGLNFARIMRAFLRADPDVIMIGEMRDEETASIGIEASLTGHLVFSTLHTNSAPETVTRLLDMGLNPLNFSDAFLGVLAQRLVRRLCTKCRKEYHPTEEEFEEIEDYYGKKYFPATGIKYKSDLTLYRPSGCEVCSGTGYRGRLGIHELMEGTPKIKKMIKKQASTEEIFKQAMEEGMTTLNQDGTLKVLQGITDLAEVRRVCIT